MEEDEEDDVDEEKEHVEEHDEEHDEEHEEDEDEDEHEEEDGGRDVLTWAVRATAWPSVSSSPDAMPAVGSDTCIPQIEPVESAASSAVGPPAHSTLESDATPSSGWLSGSGRGAPPPPSRVRFAPAPPPKRSSTYCIASGPAWPSPSAAPPAAAAEKTVSRCRVCRPRAHCT